MEENQSTPTVTTRSVGIRYGVIMGIVSIAYFVILVVAGVDMSQGIGRWGSMVYTLAILFLAHKYFKENGDGFMTIGQGTGIGFWTTLIASGISSVFTYVYIKFIDQSFIQQLLDKQREAFEEQNMSEDQIDQAMTMTAKFMTPEMMLVFGLIGGVVIGVICAVIMSLFTQKKNPEAFV
jgi:hypothetical protein